MTEREGSDEPKTIKIETGGAVVMGEGLIAHVQGPARDGIRVSDSRGWSASGDIEAGAVSGASVNVHPDSRRSTRMVSTACRSEYARASCAARTATTTAPADRRGSISDLVLSRASVMIRRVSPSSAAPSHASIPHSSDSPVVVQRIRNDEPADDPKPATDAVVRPCQSGRPVSFVLSATVRPAALLRLPQRRVWQPELRGRWCANAAVARYSSLAMVRPSRGSPDQDFPNGR
jgi:hypothetical protein